MLGNLAVYELRFGELVLMLRELCGLDVLTVHGVDTRSAIELLDRLLVTRNAQVAAAAELTVPERDRALAAVYQRTFGNKISGSPRCLQCDSPYDTDFELSDLVQTLWRELPPRVVTTATGRRFRVPTGTDELAVGHLEPDAAARAIAARCAVDGTGSADDSLELSQLLERAAPVLDLDLSGVCPECGAENALAFRMQSYLLHALANERARLAGELDVLARAYGWSASEILALPRATRLQLVRLAENHPLRRAG
jgi:hypothetical protein